MDLRVLDTTALSALMQRHPQAVERLEALGRLNVIVPQPVVAEIAYGLARLPRSKRKAQLEARFDLMAREMRRVPWTDDVSHRFGALKAALERGGTRLEDFDIAIAAHALACDGVLVTSNTRHMRRVPELRLEDWTAG